jgi:hypothetical protein
MGFVIDSEPGLTSVAGEQRGIDELQTCITTMLGNLGTKLLLKLEELSQTYTLDGADFIWDKFDANNRSCPAPSPGPDSSSLDVLSAAVFNILVKLEGQKATSVQARLDNFIKKVELATAVQRYYT